MSAREAFVDVTYRGLEVGRRLKLREVGPSTAYVEHSTPMPVGSEVVIATDDGHAIPAVVVRVHEQVAGAEMAPGMRVRALGLEGGAAAWWGYLVSGGDPQIPEPAVAPQASTWTPRAPVAAPAAAPQAPEPPADTTARMPAHVVADEEAPHERRTIMMEAAADPDGEAPPAIEMEAEEPDGYDPEPGLDTMPEEVDDDALPVPPSGNGRHGKPSRTMVMTAVELKEALGGVDPTPAEEPPPDTSGSGNGNGGSDPAPGGKGGRRRRRRR